MSAVPQTSCDWQEGFLKVMPVVETHAKIQFRRLPRERREDAVQEAIASACVSYQLLAAKGKLAVAHPGTLAKYAVNHVRNHRHVGGHQDGAKDVMSPACCNRHGVEVVSCDRYQVHASLRDGTDGWKRIAVEDRKANIPDLAAFRIDYPRWLLTLTRRDRSVISALIAGEHPSAVADRFGITRGRVSQLRRRYEREWKDFQGEAAEEAAC
jgi:hypothetical protein